MNAKDDKMILRNIELVAARKTDFLRAVMEVLDEQARNLTLYERRGLRDAIARAVATLDLKLFLTAEEMKQKELNPSVRLDDLDREAIWDSLHRELATLFPGIAKLLQG